jgi:hypothetical protein
MEKFEAAPKCAENPAGISTPECLEINQPALSREKSANVAPGAAPIARIADGVITFSATVLKDAARLVADPLREVNQVFSKRDVPEDRNRDQSSVEKELSNKELEAGINKETRKVLLKDADQYPPVKNADGSMSYRLVQFGMTDRPIDSTQQETSPKYYSRLVYVTVPRGAENLGECKFEFADRRQIQEAEFNHLLDRDRSKLKEANVPASENVNLHAHGVFTYTNMADEEAILLQLTNGHPMVNVDWQAFPNTRENPHHYSPHDWALSSYLHYMEDRASAKKANVELEPLLDKTIARIGAPQTTLIGFSHGGMFDTRYLRHRVDSHLPKLGTVLYAHPDVPVKTPELTVKGADGSTEGLLCQAACRSFVIGGRTDMALKVAAKLPFAGGERLGDDSLSTRHLIEAKNHGDPVTELPKSLPDDEHFLNYSGIANLENGDPNRSIKQLQEDYWMATLVGRRHSPKSAP